MNTDRYKAKALTVGDNPEWVEGFPVFTTPSGRLYMKDGQDDKRFGCGIEAHPNTLCQCTGLKDSQEKLGFEGDYFESKYGEKFIIRWENNGWFAQHVSNPRAMAPLRGDALANMTLTSKNVNDKQTEQ